MLREGLVTGLLRLRPRNLILARIIQQLHDAADDRFEHCFRPRLLSLFVWGLDVDTLEYRFKVTRDRFMSDGEFAEE